MKRILLCIALLWGVAAFGQSTQVATGPVDPAICDLTVGQLFFNNSTNPGVMKYCSATNTWAAVGGGATATSFPWTTLASTGTPTLTVNNGSANYFMSVTGNVTSVTTSGSPTNGTYIGILFKEDGTGGYTIPTASFPGNFVFPPNCAFATAANANNWLAWTYDGTNWQPVPGSCGGGVLLQINGTNAASQTKLNIQQGTGISVVDNGSGTATITNTANASNPVGSANVLQKTDGSGNHVASNITETGTNLTIDDNVATKGPNPWVDVTRYGVRAVSSVPSTTCTINATSTAATLGAASTFVNGDGVDCYGAGATNTMSTPVIANVTPSVATAGTNTGLVANAPSGSTPYQYTAVGIDLGGGYTAASTAVSTFIGAATLGRLTANISNIVLANNIVTVTTATPHGFAPRLFGSLRPSNHKQYGKRCVVRWNI